MTLIETPVAVGIVLVQVVLLQHVVLGLGRRLVRGPGVCDLEQSRCGEASLRVDEQRMVVAGAGRFENADEAAGRIRPGEGWRRHRVGIDLPNQIAAA